MTLLVPNLVIAGMANLSNADCGTPIDPERRTMPFLAPAQTQDISLFLDPIYRKPT